MRKLLQAILPGFFRDPVPTKTLTFDSPRETESFRDRPAVPLTADDADLLVRALTLLDRWEGAKNLAAIMGPPVVSDHQRWAGAITRHAAAAVAGGHHFVPLPVGRLSGVDQVLTEIRRKHVSWDGLDELELVARRIHALAGMADVHGWMARERGDTLLWVTEPQMPTTGGGAIGAM